MLVDDQSTFETTTRAPLTAEQRDERVSRSVLSQMSKALGMPPLPSMGPPPARREFYGPHKPNPAFEPEVEYAEPELGTGRSQTKCGGEWPMAPVVDQESRAAWHASDAERAKAAMDAYQAQKADRIAAEQAAEEALYGHGPKVSADPRSATAETAKDFGNLQRVARSMRMGDLPAGHRARISHEYQELMGLEAGELDDDIVDVDLTQPIAVPEIEGGAERQAENVARMKAAEEKREEKASKRKKSADAAEAKRRAAMSEDELQAHIEKAIDQAGKRQQRNDAIKKRYEGFVHDGTRAVRGKRVSPFSEVFSGGRDDFGGDMPNVIFRTDLAPALKRVAECIPKKGAIWVGMDKTAIFRVYSKVLALDFPYIVINEKMLGLICVDIDGSFESEADLRQQLLRYLGPKQMPTMAVGHINPITGRFENPHLLWGLDRPVLNAPRTKHKFVGKDGKERTRYSGSVGCRKGPIQTYYAVQRGLVHMLLPLGADPGYFNITKIKNPISPYWTTWLINEANYHSLKPFLALTWTDDAGKRQKFVGNPSEKLMSTAHKRAMQARNSGVEKSRSNLIWNTVGNLVGFQLRFGDANRDPAYMKAIKSKDSLYRYLVDQVTPDAVGEFGDAEVVRDVVHMRCEFTAGRWEPLRPGSYIRGRDDGFEPVVDHANAYRRTRGEAKLTDEQMAAKLAAMTDDELTDRATAMAIQGHAGQVTAAGREERSTASVAAEIMRQRNLGLPDHPPTVVKTLSLAKSTVYKVWPKALILASKLSETPTSYIEGSDTRIIPETSSSFEGSHGEDQSSFDWKATRVPEPTGLPRKADLNRTVTYSVAATVDGCRRPCRCFRQRPQA